VTPTSQGWNSVGLAQPSYPPSAARWAGFAVPTGALMARGLRGTWRRPALVVTSVSVPCIVIVSCSGTFANLTRMPGFPTSSLLSWYLPFAVVQSAALTGAGVAGTLSEDIRSGFVKRLLASSIDSSSLLTSTVLVVWARMVVPTALVLVIGLALGAELPAGPAAVVLLVVAASGAGATVALACVALAFRLPGQDAGLGMIALTIAVLLTSDALVPTELMGGWLRPVATANPMSLVLRVGRSGFLGELELSPVAAGLAALAIMLLAAWWAARRSIERWRR
jgi:ABC-2 type transporter